MNSPPTLASDSWGELGDFDLNPSFLKQFGQPDLQTCPFSVQFRATTFPIILCIICLVLSSIQSCLLDSILLVPKIWDLEIEVL